jgi:Pyruvate/2-oxoacid:ferredoxin oxidoreductase gamma subunit
VEEADVLVALTGPAYLDNVALLAPEGLLIYDEDAVPAAHGRGHGYPLVATARALRHERGVTVVALGVLVRKTGLVTPESAVAAVHKVFSGELAACNECLLRAGMEPTAREAARGR